MNGSLYWLIGLYLPFAAGSWSVIAGIYGRTNDPYSNLMIMRLPHFIFMIFCLYFGTFHWSDIKTLFQDHLWLMSLVGIFSSSAVVARMRAVKNMPIGTLTTLTCACFILSIFLYEIVFLVTLPTRQQLSLIFLILAGLIGLTFLRNYTSFNLDKIPLSALLLAIYAGCAHGLTFVMMADIARSVNAFATATICNLYLGIFVFAAMLIRKKVYNIGFDTYAPRSFIGLCILATIGITLSCGFTYAGSIGPVTILAALQSCSLIVATLLSWLFLKEKLSLPQWSVIVFVMFCIICLRLTGNT